MIVSHGSNYGFGRPANRLSNNSLTYVVYPLTLCDISQASVA